MEICSGTSQVAAVPARDRFAVPFLLEQFMPTRHLGVEGILDFVPSGDCVIGEIAQSHVSPGIAISAAFASVMFYSAEFGKARKDACVFDDGPYGSDVAPCR
jgi:hypothetical protein